MSTLREISIKAAIDSLISNGLNQAKTARELGVSRSTLRTLLKESTGGNKDTSIKGLSKTILTSYLS